MHQVSSAAEILGRCVGMRANGYFPIGTNRQTLGFTGLWPSLFCRNENIFFRTHPHRFGEPHRRRRGIGRRLPGWLGEQGISVYGGCYYYQADGISQHVRQLATTRGRAVRRFDDRCPRDARSALQDQLGGRHHVDSAGGGQMQDLQMSSPPIIIGLSSAVNAIARSCLPMARSRSGGGARPQHGATDPRRACEQQRGGRRRWQLRASVSNAGRGPGRLPARRYRAGLRGKHVQRPVIALQANQRLFGRQHRPSHCDRSGRNDHRCPMPAPERRRSSRTRPAIP